MAKVHSTPHRTREKIIIDTDIGDDIDDAFALGLAFSSPEIQVLGITTAWGDTPLRARLTARYLHAIGQQIPIAAGPATTSKIAFTQARYAEAWPAPTHPLPSATNFLREQIKKYPGQITLIELAPLTNIAALIRSDPTAFHQLKRIVMMGGSIRRGYGDLGYGRLTSGDALPHGPDPEYNILSDIPAARTVFASGIPLVVLPVDSTQLMLDEVKRKQLFGLDTPLTNTLSTLYYQWLQQTAWGPTPTLFDAMPVAFVISPSLCPTTPLRIQVNDEGYTREVSGPPNAEVCLTSNADEFFHFFMPRLLNQALGHHP
ncbi:MAG: nucleoside hydrolase [Acidobacteriaceae bacterium]